MDVSLQVFIDAPTHDLSYDTAKEAARYRRGDVVQVYLTSEVGAPYPGNPLGFIHITGIPGSVLFDKIKSILNNEMIDTSSRPHVLVRRRRWRIPPSVLPTGVRNTLIADREITVTWAQAKPYVRLKVIANRLNAFLDEETIELTDADVS